VNSDVGSEAWGREIGTGFDFNFTAAQWEKILSAVRDGCAQPSRFDAVELLRAANAYRQDHRLYRPPHERKEAWKRVAKLMQQAREALAVADPSGMLQSSTHLFFEDPNRATGKFSMLDRLEQWQRLATMLAEAADDGQPLPRMEFLENALDCWAGAGGGLSFSRGGTESRNRGRPGGPTMRFLQAVADPVMAEKALTLEGLASNITRCEKIFKEMAADDERHTTYAAAVEARAASTRLRRYRDRARTQVLRAAVDKVLRR
jgi:hypothetical protein